MSSSESDDPEDYYDDADLYSGLQNLSGHSGFHRAADFFKQTYLEEVFTSREQDEICMVDISLSVSLQSLKDSVLDAWGLMKDLPLIVRLVVDFPVYSQLKVHVSQISAERNSNIFAQLKSIIERFCEKQLKNDFFGTDEIVCDSSDGKSERRDPKKGNESGATPFELNASASFAKTVPNTSKGFFVKLYLYLQQRLLSLNDFCPICDELHDVETSISMLKPVVCEKALCIFSSQTLGLMTTVVESVRLEPKVVHLLLSTTMSAVFSERFQITMQPFIEVSLLIPDYEQSAYAKMEGREALLSALKVMPTVDSMVSTSESDLKEGLTSIHNLCYPLLRWIISSNRSHIVTLPNHKQLPFMQTEFQFLLRNSPPIEDANFRALVKRFGSVFAFHGSPIDNWHSILRKGLIVASGTEMQLHGAACGKGIYLSPNLQVALNYCMVQKLPLTKQVRSSYSIKNCITLCEVVNSPDITRLGEKWVCPHSKYVCTRFIFGYRTLKLAHKEVNVMQKQYIKMIKAALE